MTGYSVVIPSYLSAPYIAAAVQSILSQSIQPDCIFVVDDGSPDDTADVVRRLQGPIQYVRQENTGPGGATSRGIAMVDSEFVATLDADDLWLPNKVALQLEYLAREPETSAVFGHVAEFREDPSRALLNAAYPGWTRPTMMMRTSVAKGAGLIPDFPEKVGDLIDWLAALRQTGHRMVMMNDVLALRRLHEGSLTARARGELSKAYLPVIRRALQRRREQEPK